MLKYYTFLKNQGWGWSFPISLTLIFTLTGSSTLTTPIKSPFWKPCSPQHASAQAYEHYLLPTPSTCFYFNAFPAHLSSQRTICKCSSKGRLPSLPLKCCISGDDSYQHFISSLVRAARKSVEPWFGYSSAWLCREVEKASRSGGEERTPVCFRLWYFLTRHFLKTTCFILFISPYT